MSKEEKEAERIIEVYNELQVKSIICSHQFAIKCALINVQGIIEAINIIPTSSPIQLQMSVEFWQRVKTIIENK